MLLVELPRVYPVPVGNQAVPHFFLGNFQRQVQDSRSLAQYVVAHVVREAGFTRVGVCGYSNGTAFYHSSGQFVERLDPGSVPGLFLRGLYGFDDLVLQSYAQVGSGKHVA